MASSHSSISISPSPLTSSTRSALRIVFGRTKNCRFGSPQVSKNLMTFLFPFFGSTAFTISSTTSVPESSSSMSSNTSRAAERNSAVNSAISLRAAAEDLARRSARAASLARSATSIASSLRRERPVSRETRRPPRGRGDGLRLRHQHAAAASKAPQNFRLGNAPLDGRDLSIAIRVDGGHGRVEARGHEQVLQVLVAAVDEE